jgi:hypothetical protein
MMNCASCRKALLLVLSHEATGWTRWRVERHLRSCEGCRRFREQYAAVRQAVCANSPEPDDRLVQTVMGFARRAGLRNISGAGSLSAAAQEWLRPAWIYGAVSVAALLALVLAVKPMFRAFSPDVALNAAGPNRSLEQVAATAPRPSNNLDEQLDELAWLLDLTALEAWLPEQQTAIEWSETEQLASELLKWEDAET